MQTLPDTLCYLNGEYGALRDAKVSVLDRGFIFGDGLYEVVPAYGGRLFRFEEHLARLSRNLAKLRIANPHTRDEWLERCRKLLAAASVRKPSRNMTVSAAPLSADIWRASTLPSSEMLLMSPRSQRKSHAVMQATPAWRCSGVAGFITLHIMNTVGATSTGNTWSRGATPRVTWM